MRFEAPGARAASATSVTTSSGIPVAAVYGPADAEFDYETGRGDPGHYPFARGISAEMYRGKLWTMRQYAGFSTAAESNRRYRYLLAQGTTGLSVAFDLPTQLGLDSDDPLARGEVGKVGVAIDSIEDMLVLAQDIPLDRVSISMTINAPAAILLALYLAVAKRRGIPWDKLAGTVQNDILKEYAARGTYIFPPRPSLGLVTDIIAFAAREVPRWNVISISGYHIREAGSTAVQEVAFTLANAIQYVEAALAAGLAVDDFAPRLSFFFNAHNNFLEEVAKFRAARKLWAEIMRERFAAKNPRSWTLRFHTQTAGSTLTAQQPDTNVVRVALQALAAVMGGTQSLHTNARDEALALPTEEAARLALRTQQVIAHESGVPRVADPLGGAYVIEAFTEEIVARVRQYLDRIAELGGALAAIEKGFMQREIEESAFQHQRRLEAGQEIVVGVNAFVESAEDEARAIPLLVIDPRLETEQVARLVALRASRDGAAALAACAGLEADAREARSVMPGILACVEASVTVGEIVSTLKRVYGEHRDQAVW